MGGRYQDMTRVGGDWLTRPATQALFDIYDAAGYQFWFVGGCIRNALMGEAVDDIDMASDAPPEAATKFLTDAGAKVVPTGIDHGTLTVIRDGTAHEITTFRNDVSTDGRRAVVRYAQTMAEDAARRDFTINALYADRTGVIADPVGGLADIDPPNIRFIGDARDRIREDYLRSLRFFRFHARFVPAGHAFDAEALAAISETLDGLGSLSRERVSDEMMKLLATADPGPAVATMSLIGMLGRVLPGADPRALGPLIHFEGELGLAPDPLRRLSALIEPALAEDLRVSRAYLRTLSDLRETALKEMPPAEIGYRLGRDKGLSVLALRAAFLERPPDPGDAADVALGADARFPVVAADLPDDLAGPAIGERLRELESRWIASRFRLGKEQLLG